MKILFEKYAGNERLEAWTHAFDNVGDMLYFMKEKEDYLFGTSSMIKPYRIVATEICDEQLSFKRD